jgi:predicted nucleic acid-binding protein
MRPIKSIKPKPVNILVDTNVLINDFFSRKGNPEHKKRFANTSAKASMSLKRLSNNNLYVAAFSVIQLVSFLQKQKYSFRPVEEELKYVITKYKVISITDKDLDVCSDGIHTINDTDIEDNLLYCLSVKVKCPYILTYNTKDFAGYLDRRVICPGEFMPLYN